MHEQGSYEMLMSVLKSIAFENQRIRRSEFTDVDVESALGANARRATRQLPHHSRHLAGQFFENAQLKCLLWRKLIDDG